MRPAVPPILASRPTHGEQSAYPLVSSQITPGWRSELLGFPFTQTAREGTSAGCRRVGVSICAPASLSAFADILSSVHAFRKYSCDNYLQNRKTVKAVIPLLCMPLKCATVSHFVSYGNKGKCSLIKPLGFWIRPPASQSPIQVLYAPMSFRQALFKYNDGQVTEGFRYRPRRNNGPMLFSAADPSG